MITIVLIAMTVVSFIRLININIAGVSVLLGVIFFFINKAVEKESFTSSGLDIKSIGRNLKEKHIWFWIMMPIIMDIFSITLSKLIMPEYMNHVLARVEGFISLDTMALLIIQLMILALGEEIAWRAFFQNQLHKVLPVTLTVIITSIVFAVAHVSSGNYAMIAYDIFFVFINSLLYGTIFYKTENAWISAISHFSANLFSMIFMLFFL